MSRTDAFPHATTLESLRFTTLLALPNVAGGLFSRRPTVAAVLDRAGVAGRAHRLLTALHRRYGDGPIWVNVGRTPTLIVLGPEQIRFALEHAPDPFASDPEPKRSGMTKFQPHALTISRGAQWSDRRHFTETVLSNATGPGAIAGRCEEVAREEARSMPDRLTWHQFHSAIQRLARRIILGDSASADTRVSDQLVTLMRAANPPGNGDARLLKDFLATLERYVAAAEADSLVGCFAAAPTSDITFPTHQVTHWMFAMGDTLAINLWRCLALLGTDPRILATAQNRITAGSGRDYLAGCLSEAMRLWPTTPLLARTLTRATAWDGEMVPEGTQVMVVNSFNHRDIACVPYANRFDPEAWTDGDAHTSWSFNFFSRGPQGCPGADLALRLGTAILTELLSGRSPTAPGTMLDPERPLPLTLDHTRIDIRFLARR